MEEGLHYTCSENKGADQLRGYREADLRLCFRICKNQVFSQRGSYFKQQSSLCTNTKQKYFLNISDWGALLLKKKKKKKK